MNIVLASHNSGKLQEFHHLFSGTIYKMTPLSDYCREEVEETGKTFIENAIIKARYACEKTGLACIADDSGLVVPALNGAPGIYSARYAGKHGDRKANIHKLLSEMRDYDDEKRDAYFICVLVFMRHADDPCPIIAEGRLEGKITREEIGDNGYGYDPILFLPQKNATVAQLPFEEKNKMSHMALAMQALLHSLNLSKLLCMP